MRPRPARTAGFAVVLLVVGQLLALAHEANERHAICGEHGEAIEAPTLAGDVDHCEHAHLIGVETSGGDHDDCAIARFLHASATASHAAPIVAIAILETACTEAACLAAEIRTADLVLIAPKTSPPARA